MNNPCLEINDLIEEIRRLTVALTYIIERKASWDSYEVREFAAKVLGRDVGF